MSSTEIFTQHAKRSWNVNQCGSFCEKRYKIYRAKREIEELAEGKSELTVQKQQKYSVPHIALDKRGIHIIVFFLHENIYTSNEYYNMFFCEEIRNFFVFFFCFRFMKMWLI